MYTILLTTGGAWASHILNRVLFSLGKDTHRGSPKDHTLGEITKGCVIPRSLRVGLLPWQFLSWHP